MCKHFVERYWICNHSEGGVAWDWLNFGLGFDVYVYKGAVGLALQLLWLRLWLNIDRPERGAK